MRSMITAVVAGAAMILISMGAASAGPASNQPINGATVESAMQLAQYGGHCERLRWRCQHKEELGQEGMGNCQRYREECGGRASYCERLRRACEHKYERGEEGQGSCRRYREECGGR